MPPGPVASSVPGTTRWASREGVGCSGSARPRCGPHAGLRSASLGVPSRASASGLSRAPQPPEDFLSLPSTPPSPGHFSPSLGTVPLTRPLLNHSIYRPQVLARKETYIFKNLAQVHVNFCGLTGKRGGLGRAQTAVCAQAGCGHGGHGPCTSPWGPCGPGGRAGQRLRGRPKDAEPRLCGKPSPAALAGLRKTCILIKMGPFLNLSPCGSGHSLPLAGPAY